MRQKNVEEESGYVENFPLGTTLYSTLHDVLRRSWSSLLVVTASTSEFVSETRMRRALDTGALPRGERGGLLLFAVVLVVELELPPGSARSKLRFYPRAVKY